MIYNKGNSKSNWFENLNPNKFIILLFIGVVFFELGPFTNAEMADWFKHGYFTMNLLIKRTMDEAFQPLGKKVKHLSLVIHGAIHCTAYRVLPQRYMICVICMCRSQSGHTLCMFCVFV